ncbi:hypothetical protein SORBI_3007G137501 [Sorghum bicolor]|jgi:hypothetical protein|uniref:Uncharacterized protein n=1 Tax=Sorghum bicolor TaxID=4558 RepID=A0A1Z5R9R2_SORBI|nr:hypothetical protein SORBI_3007G137501 [Sorghum bicolor]
MGAGLSLMLGTHGPPGSPCSATGYCCCCCFNGLFALKILLRSRHEPSDAARARCQRSELESTTRRSKRVQCDSSDDCHKKPCRNKPKERRAVTRTRTTGRRTRGSSQFTTRVALVGNLSAAGLTNSRSGNRTDPARSCQKGVVGSRSNPASKPT